MTAESFRSRNLRVLSSAISQSSVDRYTSHGVSLIFQDGRPPPENSTDIVSSASGARRREDGSPAGRDAALASGSVHDSRPEGRAQH